MSITSKVLAAAAVLTLAGGLSTAGTVAANAATPQCGGPCVEVYSAEPCRTPGTTVWILDAADSPGTAAFPIVNGSDTDFVHPFAMTILGNPAGQLFTPIIMQHLTKPGSVPANQLWDAGHGPV
jgi:hypothetical protein